jgi:hypothetical protein
MAAANSVDGRSSAVTVQVTLPVSYNAPLWLKKAEFLRQSLLKSAFEGRLAPQDPNDEPASVLLERIRGTATPG